MRSQNEALSLDDFRLQLNSILKIESQLNLSEQKKSQFSIYKVSELPISISTVSSWIYFSLHYLWLVFLIFCYTNTFNNIFQNSSSWIIGLYSFLAESALIGQIINIPIIILIAISIIFSKKQKTEGLSFVFQYIGSKTFPYTRYLIAFCLYSTAFFAISGDMFSSILFAIMVFLVVVQTVFLQNFSFRKDQFCCKSFQFLLLSRTATLVSLIFGIVQINKVSSISQLLVFKIIQAIIGVITLLSYFSFGIYTYRHKIPRVLFFCLNTFYCSISLAMLCDTIQAIQTGKFNFALYCILFVMIITFLCYHSLDRRRRLSQIPENCTLKEKIYFIFNIFQSCDVDTEDDCELRGVLHYHYICGCDNPRCVVNFHQVYDSKKKKLCSIHKIAQSRVSLVKFYVKCLLQKAIDDDSQNTQLLLDYVEFYYLKLKNIFYSTKNIIKLQSKIITPFQRLRLFRLKKLLKEESNHFSEDLFLGKLSMERILKAQLAFETILDGMDIVIARNDLFWKYISRNEVFLTDILETVKSNFNLVDKLCEKWVELADYFQINSRWKFYFLCFTIYIKNQKLKPAMFEDFGNSVEYESIFKTNNHFIDKTTEKEDLYNPIMLYEQNTCYITATCDEQNMIIRRVSDYFKRYFDYEPKEIQGSHLHSLMAPSIKAFHHKMFLEWIKQGRNSNQNCYNVHKVLPMTKKGFLAPSFKFYKSYLRIGGEIEYIGMFKRNKQDEMIILTNDKFQIEAITLGLAQKLKIFNDDYANFQGLNLLVIIPMLAKYTHYSKYLEEHDEDFLEHDENQNYFKKQSSYLKSGNDFQSDILQMRKTLNLTNVKMFIPNDMLIAKEEYKQNSQTKQKFQAIRECYGMMRKRKGFLKFKGEMYIHSKSQGSPANRYYEIEINQLQQNNRLQKLKLQQQRISEVQSDKNIDSSMGEEGLMQVDMQMFLQLTKKKNKVVLFPSNNVFIKEENNQALTQISHITNISLSIRIIVSVFIVTLLAILIVEILLASQFTQINEQYYWTSIHQKMNFLLNSQYNIKHLQTNLTTGAEQSFYIEYYTKFVTTSFDNSNFGALIYDPTVNSYQKIYPYFPNPYPYPILTNISCPPLDQLDLLYKMKQCVITINRVSQLDPSNNLENKQYHIFNNYIYSFYTKSQNLKNNLIQRFSFLFSTLENTVIGLGLSEIALIVACFLFSLSRLMKVTNGFSQLLSIFIQMDNADIRKISKFIDYERVLFDHLRDKYNKMKDNTETILSASSSFLRDLQKPSLEMGDQTMAGIANANLNKKIKKIDLGNEITKIKRTILFLIVLFLIMVGAVMFLPVIYSRLSIEQVNNLEQLGFTIIENNSLPNVILTGAIQKVRNAQIYRLNKYSGFLANFSALMLGEDLLKLSSGTDEVSVFFKSYYYQNFCILQMGFLNSTFETLLPQFCGGSDLSQAACNILYQTLIDQNIAQRCQNIQSTLLRKGTVNFYNSFSNRMLLFFKNAGIVTVQDVIEMNQALNIIGLYDVGLMNKWLNSVSTLVSNRLVNVIACIIAAFFGVLLLHIIFVEFLIIKSLAANYEMFRRMHENMIPEFVINKEKIIKAKLVKQGFMKE